MKNRDRITLAAAAVLVLVIGGVAAGWWWMAVGRHPLRGTLHHDFGEVPVGVGRSEFHHTYELVNHTGAPVTIDRIIPGCGCTEVTADPMTVAPGDTVDVNVTLTLSRAGRKDTKIDLLLAGHGLQQLWLSAVGIRALSVEPGVLEVRLERDRAVPYRIVADVQGTDEQPPDPKLASHDSIEVRFVNWELTTPGDAERKTAARWRGHFEVAAKSPDIEVPMNAFFFVTVGDTNPIRVSVKPPRGE